jgi:hypothetical protein
MDDDSAFFFPFLPFEDEQHRGERIEPTTMSTAGRPPSLEHGKAALLRRIAASVVHVGRIDGEGRRAARTTAAVHYI